MSDKRKPVFIFLLKNLGKKSNKIEIFEAIDFEKNKSSKDYVMGKKLENAYRIRANGKWWPPKKKQYFWKSEIRDILFKSINF
jgi:hypothetical protein